MSASIRTLALDARGYFTRGGQGRYIRCMVQALLRLPHHNLSLRILISNRHEPGEVPIPEGAIAEVRQSEATWMDMDEEDERLPGEISDVDLFHSLTGHWLPSATPFVATIHDLTPLVYPEKVSSRIQLQFARTISSLYLAEAVLADSHSTRRDLEKLISFDPRKVFVIPCAMDPQFQPVEVRAAELNRFGVEPDRFLLYVGVLAPHKNLDRLLAGYARSGVDVPLLIVGAEGWGCDGLHQEVDRLELTDRVHFLGRLDDEDLVRLYSACRLFLYPSLHEGFGLPVLEAMACGAAVICSSSSSLPEVTGDAAMLVDPKNIEEIAESIRFLDRNEGSRRDHRRRSLCRAGTFSWERAASETLGVYRHVLARKSVTCGSR